MFTPLEQKARVLNKRLMDLQQAMCEKYQISELSPVGVPFQNTITVCGIICCEAASGRINKTSVVLEGSRRYSMI
jgi:DNA polymerase alpha subunit B